MKSSAYWSDIARQHKPWIEYPVWRAYCDALHTGLMDQWLSGKRFRSSLKTDLFDEACGCGLIDELRKISGRVTGMDISRDIADGAAARHPEINTAVADVRELPFESGSFDFIVSNSTLDHFEDTRDLEKSVREIIRVLAPGGHLLITLDNPVNPVVALRNRLPSACYGRSSLAPYFVGRTVSLSTMGRLLESCGCEVMETKHIMHVPRLIFLHCCRCFNLESVAARRFLGFMAGF